MSAAEKVAYKVIMPEKQGNPEPAPALGFSLQVDLGAGRVATLQTFLPNDCAQHELNAMLDKMTSAGDRQRAHYRIEELERDLKIEKKRQAEYLEDRTRLDAEYNAEQLERAEQIEKMRKTVDTFKNNARDDHVGRGRRGDFKLRGTELSHVNAVEAGIEKIKQEMQSAKDEREKVVSAKIPERQAEIIANIEADIAKCKAMVAGGRADSAG